MPIYEYLCRECGRRNTLLVMKREGQPAPACRHCRSEDLQRLLSGFAVHRTEADRLRGLDPSRTPDDSFYRDDRNIGLRAKKRMQELGVSLGDSLDEKIEKARTSKLDAILGD